MIKKEKYSYASLKAGLFDLQSFPPDRWHELINGIEPSTSQISVSTISKKLDLYWPRSGRFISMKIGDCLFPAIDALLEIASMGERKVRTIVQILTYLHENQSAFSEISEQDTVKEASSLSLSMLLEEKPDEWKSIAISEWNRTCNLVPKTSHREPVARYANDLGIYWPAKSGWEDWKIEDCLKDSYVELAATRNIGKVKLESIVRILIHLATSLDQKSEASEHQELVRSENEKIWDHPVISGLAQRERQVFEARLLTVYDKPTLDAIGKQYDVTRERIRQIQSNILKNITASGLEAELRKILTRFKEQQLLAIYSERRYLLRDEVPSIIDSLNQELVLAIALCHKSIYQLLSSIAVEAPNGWYFGKRSDFIRSARTLKGKVQRFLPAPIHQLSEIFELPFENLMACSLLHNLAIPCGVLLLPNGAGKADATRAAECFETAISRGRHFWLIDDLIQETKGELHPHEQRLYRLSISRCNRLFLSTPSYSSILDYSMNSQLIDSSKAERNKAEDNSQDQDPEHGSVEVLHRVLNERWPITGAKLIEYMRLPQYRTHLSDNSLLLLLTSIPACVRLAPGVYGPKDYTVDPSRLRESRTLILRDGDIRAYCFARRAGENCPEFFPLWDAEQEQLWYRKLRRRNEEDPLLRSFVKIANQSKWPELTDSDKLELMELSVTAKFSIEPNWVKNRSYSLPDLATSLTALRYARDIGPLSWIRANHVTGVWKLTEESGVSVLICGIVLGLLDSSMRPWWKPIPASNDFDTNWKRIEALFLEKDIPDWNHPVIMNYFAQARELAADKNLGFIKYDSLDKFIHSLRSRTK